MDRLALVSDMVKTASKMSLQKREALPAKSFAIPQTKAKKIGVSGEIKGESKGKYPIPDIRHARNALARVSQHGTPAERQAVRSKVYSKFPGLKEGFESRHGESPTAKMNIKKVVQGGIGKTAQSEESLKQPGQLRARNVILGRGPRARAARDALRSKMRSTCPDVKEACGGIKIAAVFDELQRIYNGYRKP